VTSCSSSLFEHDLFGKPVSTFPDHALVACDFAAQSGHFLEILQRAAPH
jgi:hypothetical protein